MKFRLADQFAIAGVYDRIPNPDRKWWQLWKPRFVAGELTKFRVIGGDWSDISLSDVS